MNKSRARYQIHETEIALQDLTEIIAYLTQRLHSKQAAQRVLSAYEAAIDSLESFPCGFPLVREHALSILGYRWIAVESYVAFYTVDKTRHRVNIERILHRSRNWEQILTGTDGPDEAA